MAQPGGGNGLASEAFHRRVGGQVRVEDLDCDATIQNEVGGFPHLRHPAGSNLAFQTVPVAEHGTWHVVGRRGRRVGRVPGHGGEGYWSHAPS